MIPLVVFTLVAPPSFDGKERRACLLLDSGTGRWVAIERYSGGTLTDALERLQAREHFPWDRLIYGPELLVPARQLYEITDSLSGRGARRQRAQERMDTTAPMRPEDVPGRQGE